MATVIVKLGDDLYWDIHMESHGAGSRPLFNTISVSTSATCWMYGFATTTSQFFFVNAGQQSYTVQSHWGDCQLHATFTPAHCGCWRESNNAWKYFMFIQPHSCLDVSWVSVHVLTCQCVFPVWFPYLCICSWLVNCRMIWLDTLLSSP